MNLLKTLTTANSGYGTWSQNAADFSLDVSLQFTDSANIMQANQILDIYVNYRIDIANQVPKGFSSSIDSSIIQISG